MQTIYVGFEKVLLRKLDVNMFDENFKEEDLFNQHARPVKVFDDETEARRWIWNESFGHIDGNVRIWYVPINLETFHDNAITIYDMIHNHIE